MQILFKIWGGGEAGYDIAAAFERACNGADYDRGALEEIRATAQNVSKMLGALVEMLHEKEQLTGDDVIALLGHSGGGDWSWE